MQLVDEDDRVLILHQLFHDRLQPLFKLPAVLRPGHDQRKIQPQYALVGQEAGHFAVGDALRQSLHNRRLAHAGLADQNGVIFGPPAQNLHYPLQLAVAPHQRIELPIHRRLGQVAAELGQQTRLSLPLLLRSLLLRHPRQLVADLRQLQSPLLQNLRRKALLLAQQSQQQMFGPDVLVSQPLGFFGCVRQHPLALV